MITIINDYYDNRKFCGRMFKSSITELEGNNMEVKAFKAIRPQKELAAQVSSLPYDVYSEAEARKISASNPNSFMHIVRPETDFSEGTNPYSAEVYEHAKELIDMKLEEGVFVQESRDAFYIYRETMNGRPQTGLVACYPVDDYLNNKIKKHEFTRPDKEDDRTRHIDVTNAQTGMVFLAFNKGEKAREVLIKYSEGEPMFDFVSVDGVRQQVWEVETAEGVEEIREAFGEVESLYIADGHHRTASAATICQKRREEKPDYTGNEEFNYFQAVAFPAEQLLILPYYRVVKDLNGMNPDAFMEKLSERFIIEEKNPEGYEPDVAGQFYMLLLGKWYLLTARPEILKTDVIGCLDVSILQDNVLTPMLGIEDVRTSDRIDFVGGIRGLKELEKRCSEGWKVAFATRHTTPEQLMAVADEGKVMPPKSTWFEPKLQSGLFVHRI